MSGAWLELINSSIPDPFWVARHQETHINEHGSKRERNPEVLNGAPIFRIDV